MYPRPRILERTEDTIRIETSYGRNFMLIVLTVGAWFVQRWLGFGISIAVFITWTYQVVWTVDRKTSTIMQERRLLEFTFITHQYSFPSISALVIRPMPALIHLGGYTLFLETSEGSVPLKLLSYAVTKKQLYRVAQLFLPYLPEGLRIREDSEEA